MSTGSKSPSLTSLFLPLLSSFCWVCKEKFARVEIRWQQPWNRRGLCKYSHENQDPLWRLFHNSRTRLKSSGFFFQINVSWTFCLCILYNIFLGKNRALLYLLVQCFQDEDVTCRAFPLPCINCLSQLHFLNSPWGCTKPVLPERDGVMPPSFPRSLVQHCRSQGWIKNVGRSCIEEFSLTFMPGCSAFSIETWRIGVQQQIASTNWTANPLIFF